MVTPLIYVEIFNKKPYRDDLIRWLNIKRQEHELKSVETIADYNCLYEFWNFLMSCNWQEKHRDGYIDDGAIYYDKRQNRCFELGEI
jgi:hypothetical protein